MAQRIRCFVAIEIPNLIRDELAQIQEALRKQIKQASWVKPGNIHLTLKFLGDVEVDAIKPVERAIKQVATLHSPFPLQIGGIGVFPHLARPRVIWAGVKAGGEKITALAQEIDLALNRCGFPLDDKRFNPHLTIARLKKRLDMRPFMDGYRQYDEIDGATMTVREISLIRSQLHPEGAVYTTLQSYPLA